MPITADDIFDGDWDGVAPQQRGCFRALAVPPSSKAQWTNGGIVSISVNPKTPRYGGGDGNKFQGDSEEAPKSKLISDPPRSKSVPPSSSWRSQRIKTVVVQEDSRIKSAKSTASTVSDDTDALLGRRKLKTAKKSSEDYDDRIDTTYVPPQKDRFIWNQSSASPTSPTTQSKQTMKTSSKDRTSSFLDLIKDKADNGLRATDPSSKGNTKTTSAWRSSGNQNQLNRQTRDIGNERSFFDTKQDRENRDITSKSSGTDLATSHPNPVVSNAISRWKTESKDLNQWESSSKKNSSSTKPILPSKGSPSNFVDPTLLQSYEIQRKNAGDVQNLKRLDLQNDLYLADLLSSNLKQMERDIEDLNKRKYSKESSLRQSSSKEQEYLLNKQRIQEQEEILLREQKLIPAEISLQSGVRDAYIHSKDPDEDDSVSELGTESVTPKLNTSGLTLVYTDRGKRANYVNDIDDTVEIHDETKYSSYHRGVGNHFKNRLSRRDATPKKKSDYGPNRRMKSKSLTRFDNRGLPDVSLIDSDSEISARDLLEDDFNYPLHRQGLSLTEAFNDFGLDDRISTVRKSQRYEDDTEILEDYEYKRENIKVGRRMQNLHSPPSESPDTTKSNQSTAITRLLASRALRSNKYVEAGGAIRLKRDHVTSPIEKRRFVDEKPESISRSNSTKRGTLPMGSFPVVTTADYEPYQTPKEHFDKMNSYINSIGTQRSRRMMRSL